MKQAVKPHGNTEAAIYLFMLCKSCLCLIRAAQCARAQPRVLLVKKQEFTLDVLPGVCRAHKHTHTHASGDLRVSSGLNEGVGGLWEGVFAERDPTHTHQDHVV